MKRNLILFFLIFPALALRAETNLEAHFNLCLEFGAPPEVVQLFQEFRTYREENNGTVSYVAREESALLDRTPFSEYQIWYAIDKDEGLYQSSLTVRADTPELRKIFTDYLRKFSALYGGEPVYSTLENGSLLVFWYHETTFTVKARLLLDIVNPYKFVSITHCSPKLRHTHLLKTLYNGDDQAEEAPGGGSE